VFGGNDSIFTTLHDTCCAIHRMQVQNWRTMRGMELKESKVETHPVQYRLTPARIPKAVAMRAYEAYCEIFGPQEALVSGWCRGGFSGGELIAFLYARSFPNKSEWPTRFNEAIDGAEAAR
jgi:hypothetical protein